MARPCITSSSWPGVFCLLFMVLVSVGTAFADVVESNHSIIVGSPDHAEIQIDPEIAYLLKRFYEQPSDLKLIADLDANTDKLLDYIDSRLSNEDRPLSDKEANELLTVMSLMKDERALAALLALAGSQSNDTDASQAVLLILRDLPVTAPVIAYVDGLIERHRANHELIRSALLYYMAVRQNAGMRWAAYYRSPGMDPRLRFAGLSLAAVLSKDDQVTHWILTELKATPAIPAYQQYYLLAALHANVKEAEFDQLLPQFTVSPVVVKEFQRLRDFNRSVGEEKHRLAGFMLASPYLDQQRAAIKYFIEKHEIDLIWPRLDTARKLSVVRLSNLHGLPIVDSDDELPVESKAESDLPDTSFVAMSVYVVCGVLVVLISWFGFRRILRNCAKPGVSI